MGDQQTGEIFQGEVFRQPTAVMPADKTRDYGAAPQFLKRAGHINAFPARLGDSAAKTVNTARP